MSEMIKIEIFNVHFFYHSRDFGHQIPVSKFWSKAWGVVFSFCFVFFLLSIFTASYSRKRTFLSDS